MQIVTSLLISERQGRLSKLADTPASLVPENRRQSLTRQRQKSTNGRVGDDVFNLTPQPLLKPASPVLETGVGSVYGQSRQSGAGRVMRDGQIWNAVSKYV